MFKTVKCLNRQLLVYKLLIELQMEVNKAHISSFLIQFKKLFKRQDDDQQHEDGDEDKEEKMTFRKKRKEEINPNEEQEI